MRGEDRTEPAVAARLVQQREARGAHQHRVAAPVIRVRRHDDRPIQVRGCVQERADHLGPHGRLVTERDEDGVGPLLHGGSTGRQRAGQPAFWLGIDDPALRPPRDRGLDRGGVGAQDHDDVVDAGLGQAVEGVLEERPAIDRRKELPAPEPGAGARSQHDRSDSALVHRCHLPTCHRGE